MPHNQPFGAERNIRFSIVKKLSRLEHSDDIDLANRIRHEGPLSTVKGVGVLGLRHVPLNYHDIAGRVIGVGKDKLVGIGTTAFVLRNPDGDSVTKYFGAKDNELGLMHGYHQDDISMVDNYLGGIVLPTTLGHQRDSVGKIRGPFVTHRQPYLRGFEDIFDISDKIIDSKNGSFNGLRQQVGEFLSGSDQMLKHEGAYPDLLGFGNLSVVQNSGVELRLLDTVLYHQGKTPLLDATLDNRLERIDERVGILKRLAA